MEDAEAEFTRVFFKKYNKEINNLMDEIFVLINKQEGPVGIVYAAICLIRKDIEDQLQKLSEETQAESN